MRRERSLAATRLIELAEKLGAPRDAAEELADKVLLYEITPAEAEARLRRLAGSGR